MFLGKMMKEDKILKGVIEKNLVEYEKAFTTFDGKSLPSCLSTSPLGSMSDTRTKRLLLYLVGTLNYLFSDYDFR